MIYYVCLCGWSEPATEHAPAVAWACRGCGRAWLPDELQRVGDEVLPSAWAWVRIWADQCMAAGWRDVAARGLFDDLRAWWEAEERRELVEACFGSVPGLGDVTVQELAETLSPAAGWTCTGCGCSDLQACPGGCSWVAERLCSRCAHQLAQA